MDNSEAKDETKGDGGEEPADQASGDAHTSDTCSSDAGNNDADCAADASRCSTAWSPRDEEFEQF
jgi:hypothetical protein